MEQKKKISLFIVTAVIVILLIVLAVIMNNGKEKELPEINRLDNTISVNETIIGPQDPIDQLPTDPVETQTQH